MSPGITETGAHLTTSRVKRLLRPLRNKCLSLSTVPQSAATAVSRTTYSKQCSNWDQNGVPPLTVLRSSSGAAKLRLDRSGADELELSRRIYAVCDAFRNVAHVAYGKSYTERVPSLAAMCALIIGDHMPVAGSDPSTANESEDSATEEDDIMKIVDGIYESVPSHYRRFSIVSHALSMVLLTCYHHHTLVNVLLDVCMSFALAHESSRLLDIVLSQAFLPANATQQSPITHPAHTNYLVDLHARWIAGKQRSAVPCEAYFTTFTFCEAIVDTLSQSGHPRSHTLWTCRPMSKLVRTIETRDVRSFILLVGAAAKTLLPKVGSKQPDAEPLYRTQNQVAEWLASLFDAVATWTMPFSESSLAFLSIIDLLDDCRSMLLHSDRPINAESQVRFADIVTVFATHIYVNLGSSSNKTDRLLAILEASCPMPTTFTKLVCHFCRHAVDEPIEALLEKFTSQVDNYSAALLSQKLLKLDASLWACALHHFETDLATSQQGNSALLAKYKVRFMDAVDTAEKRCFGRGLPDSSPSVPLLARPKKGNRRMPSGHWEWEEMVGCWIRQTPIHKKQKLDNDASLIHKAPLLGGSIYNAAGSSRGRGGLSRSLSAATPSSLRISQSRTCPRSSSPHTSECDSFAETSDTGSEYQDSDDKENILTHPPRTRKRYVTRQPPQKKRQSNFSSLIADAQSNRIVLHPESGWKLSSSPICETHIVPPLQPHISRPKHPPRAGVTYPSPSPQPTSNPLLPSDDSLDLFACKTSSPARC